MSFGRTIPILRVFDETKADPFGNKLTFPSPSRI